MASLYALSTGVEDQFIEAQTVSRIVRQSANTFPAYVMFLVK